MSVKLEVKFNLLQQMSCFTCIFYSICTYLNNQKALILCDREYLLG